MSGADHRITVVMATRDRRDEALRALGHLTALPERPPIILVDNHSSDGTGQAARSAYPDISVVELGGNRGAVARNLGVTLARTPYVAFSDDDSWWAPGALSRAADAFDASPRLALVAARVLVGDDEALDPTCLAMADSPLPPEHDLPGPPVLGFLACGAVVRRPAFLDVGGFSDLLFFFGEEELLALDLAEAGWGLAYMDDVVAHHHPSLSRDWEERQRLQVRNTVLALWLRRPLGPALSGTAGIIAACREAPVRQGLVRALLALPTALARRRVVSSGLERRVRLLEDAQQRVAGALS